MVWILNQAARWLKYRFASRSLILLYHRVTDLSNDPYLLAVKPEHFAEQMELIRKRCSPIRLEELIRGMRNSTLPNRSVVVTFDDGYADNLYQAKPILERYEIPATVFVTAGHVGSQREFWWDELDRLLLQPGVLPTKRKFDLNGSFYDWQQCQANILTQDEYERYREWHVEREDTPTARHQLFRWVYDRLHSMKHEERQRVFDDLRNWVECGSIGRVTHRAVTENELVRLEEGGLIEIGAHTVTHCALTNLSADEQRNEIKESKEFLETILKHSVTSFAFPHGLSNQKTISILQESGFDCACATNADAVWRRADIFQLPRLCVRDWDGETFSQWLKWWMDG